MEKRLINALENRCSTTAHSRFVQSTTTFESRINGAPVKSFSERDAIPQRASPRAAVTLGTGPP